MAHQEAEDLADLGTIQVTLGHVERAEFTRYYDEPATSADDLVAEAPGNGVVSEKAVKGRAISHAFR